MSDTQRRTSAERMREHRQRRAAGQVAVAISINPEFVADLVALGWLADAKRKDRSAVGAAFLAFAQHAWDASRLAPAMFEAPSR